MEFLRIEIEIIIGSEIEEGNKKQITSKYLKNQIQSLFFFYNKKSNHTRPPAFPGFTILSSSK